MRSFELDKLNQSLQTDGFVDLSGLIEEQQIDVINNLIESAMDPIPMVREATLSKVAKDTWQTPLLW